MKSLRTKWIWIAGLVIGLGCGDDDSLPESNANSKLTTSNNATNADTNNTGSTNQVANNDVNPQTTTNTSTTNTSTTNTSTTNTSTNNTPTNNATNNPTMGISCMEILQCLLVCTTGDATCQDACSAQGTVSAQMEIDAFLGCVDTRCAEAMTVTTLTECTLEYCSEEQNTCLGM